MSSPFLNQSSSSELQGLSFFASSAPGSRIATQLVPIKTSIFCDELEPVFFLVQALLFFLTRKKITFDFFDLIKKFPALRKKNETNGRTNGRTNGARKCIFERNLLIDIFTQIRFVSIASGFKKIPNLNGIVVRTFLFC